MDYPPIFVKDVPKKVDLCQPNSSQAAFIISMIFIRGLGLIPTELDVFENTSYKFSVCENFILDFLSLRDVYTETDYHPKVPSSLNMGVNFLMWKLSSPLALYSVSSHDRSLCFESLY
jgi:hypothetical protein